MQEILIVSIGGFLLFVVMPIIISVASYQEKKLKLQRELAKSGGAEVRTELATTQMELARLRDRVAVLERLATDDDRKLSDEIGRLSHEETGRRA